MSLEHHSRRTDAGDAEIGRRLRARRLQNRMSQGELGALVGVTFQQLQKYETGVNRISAGRLHRIAEILEIPMSYFFYDGDAHEKKGDVNSPLELLRSEGAVRLVCAYCQ